MLVVEAEVLDLVVRVLVAPAAAEAGSLIIQAQEPVELLIPAVAVVVGTME